MVLHAPGEPLRHQSVKQPVPGPGQVLIAVEACAVCRTDLHIVDGELTRPSLPLIPGHEIVGRVVDCAPDVAEIRPGMRVGVGWMASTCGVCGYCQVGQENLCDRARFTGYDVNGGYAQYCVADARYCFVLDGTADPVELAPLMCAGLIGYRSLKLAGTGRRLGIYGFGAAGHILAQIAIAQGREVLAFTRPGDQTAQQHARALGCSWAGGSDEMPPGELDVAIIFAPVGALIPQALGCVRKGGVVVCGGIHMSTIPAFDYGLLWGERVVRSVANLTRADATEFLSVIRTARVAVHPTQFALTDANVALEAVRNGALSGAAVLVVQH